jgi:hypothetical protein
LSHGDERGLSVRLSDSVGIRVGLRLVRALASRAKKFGQILGWAVFDLICRSGVAARLQRDFSQQMIDFRAFNVPARLPEE